MKIDRMVEGGLYSIKPNICLRDGRTGPAREFRVLGGWRVPEMRDGTSHPPFIYLGWKEEEWMYHYLNTHKIHYVMWKGEICVMDNSFAKHIVPVREGEEDGKGR